jgi:hypothetical protein
MCFNILYIIAKIINHQEKKNMPTIFRLGARAISTCLVLLAAAW